MSKFVSFLALVAVGLLIAYFTGYLGQVQSAALDGCNYVYATAERNGADLDAHGGCPIADYVQEKFDSGKEHLTPPLPLETPSTLAPAHPV